MAEALVLVTRERSFHEEIKDALLDHLSFLQPDGTVGNTWLVNDHNEQNLMAPVADIVPSTEAED